MKITLYYDKECPFCNAYANYIKVKEHHQLLLRNARDSKLEIQTFKSLGFDINNGFIIEVDDKTVYQGADAIVFFNKLANKNYFFYDSLFFRRAVYPIVKFMRKVILRSRNKSSTI